ncbi:hypothetical protein [Nocardia salmonicida]|uniref:hypothetical protein n=1 Tax=Nocardia salmonicida TaxID=53431 RepID=UPI0007A3D52F|nr:hypothetical protein [Nocardia salmonicida]
MGIHPRLSATSAAVLDLDLAVIDGRDPFVPKLLGGTPAQVPDRYRKVSPIRHLPAKDTHITR